MIKVNKIGIKHASFYKVSMTVLNHLGEGEVIKLFKQVHKPFKLPKNTLKVKYLKPFIGLHNDDFAMNLKTVSFSYIVYTFKR